MTITSENIKSKPRQRRKDTTDFEKSNRVSQVIRLPFNETDYEKLVSDKISYKNYLKEFIKQCPELFPLGIEQGFRLDDIRFSNRLNLPWAQLEIVTLNHDFYSN